MHPWRSLEEAVESSGASGFRAALGWQLFHVPNVSGAQGMRCRSRCKTHACMEARSWQDTPQWGSAAYELMLPLVQLLDSWHRCLTLL